MVPASPLTAARVLIIDDSEDDVRLIERLLARGGFRNVAAATNPAHAVEQYRCSRPDVVLLDLNMPEMSGLEVLDLLTGMEPDRIAPVLMLTGETQIQTRVTALERGARDFLSKPVHSEEMLARVRNLAESSLLLHAIKGRSQALQSSVDLATVQLRKSRLETVRRLAIAAEWRDETTGQHLARIGRYCALLGEAVGLDPALVTQLALTAPLHDIGKIALPDTILRLKGPLSPADRKVMQTHTVLGAQILGGSELPELQMAERIALTHHEWWDGYGYPTGLRGTDIPLEGRFCAIADVFDALTSARPYKASWSIDEALEEIVRKKGRQFDPALVDAFVGERETLRRIRDEFSALCPTDWLTGRADVSPG